MSKIDSRGALGLGKFSFREQSWTTMQIRIIRSTRITSRQPEGLVAVPANMPMTVADPELGALYE